MIFYLREEKANQGGKAYGSIRHTLHPHYNWMCPRSELRKVWFGQHNCQDHLTALPISEAQQLKFELEFSHLT